jgi:hypothetical protein
MIENAKGVIRSHKSKKRQRVQWSKEKGQKDREYNDQKKKDKKTMIYKTQHRKLKIEPH